MASLTNEQINQTYDSLIKTIDNLPIDGTHKVLSDGVGTALTMSASNAGINFSGDIDFSAATVTGLPGGTDTTYDFGAVGAAGNINFALSGSDASNDVVTMQAGTNITLTDNGANTFTIDAAGGGGGSAKSIVITTGTVDTWAGPAGQDVIVSQALIPANTITGAATITFHAPVFDGSEGQWNYTSFQIAPTPGDFNYISLLGQQSSTGGGDPYTWYRKINIAANGNAYYKDTNAYFWPGQGGDPIAQITNMDWTIDNYFTVTAWCDAENAKFTVYVPTLTIVNA